MDLPNRNDLCWCGSGKKYKKCHLAFDEKLDYLAHQGVHVPDHDMIKTPAQIAAIKESCLLNTAILDEVAKHIAVGMSTEEVNRIVHEKTLALGGIPAPLDFEGFPKSTCTSINNEVCHGIPAMILFSNPAISSMWMCPPSMAAIFPMPPVCLCSGKYHQSVRSWSKPPKNA